MFRGMCVLVALLLMVNPIFAMGFNLNTLNEDDGQVGVDLSKANKSFADGLLEGEMAASSSYSSSGWFLGGVGSGILLGLIGTLIIGLSATSGDVKPDPISYQMIQDYPEDYKMGYLQGYDNKGESKRITAAVGGGLLGTLIFVALVFGASS